MNKIYLWAVGASAMIASTAMAGTIAPDSVKFDDGVVSESLTGAAGNVEKGKTTFANRKQGNCLACHINGDMKDLPFHGEVGPPLDGVADRYEDGELRAILVNSKSVFEDSIMPSFYKLENGARTAEKFQGKTILSAEQIEDIIAYLKTLKEE